MNSKQLHDMLLGHPVTICGAYQVEIQKGRLVISNTDTSQGSGLEVIKLEFILRLKIKRGDWLLADTSPQAANHCALF